MQAIFRPRWSLDFRDRSQLRGVLHREAFPRIPGFRMPDGNLRPPRLDLGARFEVERIADTVPPVMSTPYEALVPKGDADGLDQGGIAETSRPTSHSAPIYIEEGVVHYCVPNMPAACARSASLALEQALLPFVKKLLNKEDEPALRSGFQVQAGKIVHEQLARDTKRPYR